MGGRKKKKIKKKARMLNMEAKNVMGKKRRGNSKKGVRMLNMEAVKIEMVLAGKKTWF